MRKSKFSKTQIVAMLKEAESSTTTSERVLQWKRM